MKIVVGIAFGSLLIFIVKKTLHFQLETRNIETKISFSTQIRIFYVYLLNTIGRYKKPIFGWDFCEFPH